VFLGAIMTAAGLAGALAFSVLARRSQSTKPGSKGI
jgi:hypothetical protein